MADVVRWVDTQEDERGPRGASSERERGGRSNAFEAIVAAGRPDPLEASTRPPRPCSPPTPTPASSPRRMTSELRAERLLDGGRHTAYLCAPAHEQRRLQPLFATLVQEIVAHAYERATETGKPLDPPLLLVLDECANIAPLRDLATLASTGAGQGIQLVSVFQDMAQINAVYGRDRAPTIVSNHRAKVILSGIADPQTLDYVGRLLGDEEVRQVVVDERRRRPPLDDRVRRLPEPRAGERPPRDATRARAARLRPPCRRRGSRSVRGSRIGSCDASQAERHWCRPGGAATVKIMLEDLTKLPPKRLETPARGARARGAPVRLGDRLRRQSARTASPSGSGSSRRAGATCSTSRACSRRAGRPRRDRLVAPLAEPRHPHWRLLLRVSFERPVLCDFVVRFDITDHPSDQLRRPCRSSRREPVRARFRRLWRKRQTRCLGPGTGRRDCVFELLAQLGPDRANRADIAAGLAYHRQGALHVVGGARSAAQISIVCPAGTGSSDLAACSTPECSDGARSWASGRRSRISRASVFNRSSASRMAAREEAISVMSCSLRRPRRNGPSSSILSPALAKLRVRLAVAPWSARAAPARGAGAVRVVQRSG